MREKREKGAREIFPSPSSCCFSLSLWFSVFVSLRFPFLLCLSVSLSLCSLCSLCLSVSFFSLSFSASLFSLSLCFLCLCVPRACLLFGLPCCNSGGHTKTENVLFWVHILCIGRLRIHHATSIPFYFLPLPDYEEDKKSSV